MLPQLPQNFDPVRGAPHSVQKRPVADVAIGGRAGARAPVGGAKAAPSLPRTLSDSASSSKAGRSLGSGAQQRVISSAISDIAGASGTGGRAPCMQTCIKICIGTISGKGRSRVNTSHAVMANEYLRGGGSATRVCALLARNARLQAP